MNSKPKPLPSEHEINQLLSRQYRDTSPEFETRWVNLKRDLRQRPVTRVRAFGPWNIAGWLGIIGAAAAVVFIVYTVRMPAPLPETNLIISPQLAELMSMDEVLGQALPLLDEENRSALLNLPAPH